ncbi:metal-dependent hydrolase [uncultured Methanobacterium sp.]|uniref:metal-dependent hydrolase n=1 Tax=uncultured Methanobacterium sp. TaxID=176306 RepID=UPI002AA82A16|nr:metal-dependent hydrolase [uncultured Methanobacterium sp.]
MKFYTHIPAGLLLYTILVWILNQPYTIGGVLFVIFISILPDLLDRVLGPHRGWGHSAIMLIPMVSIALWIPELSIAGLSAFLMHILLDSITKKGVPILYPFNKTRLVMPKKEKSRIQTGHKKEIALCLIIIFILIPASYGVLHGFPNISDTLKGNNSTNKTNSSLLNKDYRSPLSYNSTSTVPYSYSKSGNSSSQPSTSASNSAKNSSINWSSLNDYLTDWWNNLNAENQDNQTDQNNQNNQNNGNNSLDNNNNNNNNNNTNSAIDVLFGDLRYDNLTEGEQMEENMSMDDGDDFFTDMFGDSSNVNPDDDSQYSNQYQDGYYDDSEWDGSGNYFFIMGALLTAGGFILKT